MDFLLLLLSAVCLLSVKCSSPSQYSEIHFDSDLSDLSDSEAAESGLGAQIATLSIANSGTSLDSFPQAPFQDIDFFYCRPVSSIQEIITVDDHDPFLMDRVLNELTDRVPSTPLVGRIQNFDGTFAYFPHHVPYSQPIIAETIDYEIAFADPIVLQPANPLLHTPPRTAETTRKRMKTPAGPSAFLTDRQRRCMAAREALKRHITRPAAPYTPVQQHLNFILDELDYRPFTSQEFWAFDNAFRSEFLILVQRCPEDVFIPAMLYALTSEQRYIKFLCLYKHVLQWQSFSSVFAQKLLKGIMLLNQVSDSAFNLLTSARNHRFFFNHVNMSREYIGVFHFDQVVIAVSWSTGFVNFQNRLKEWILSQLQPPHVNQHTPVYVLEGFLPILHRSRCMFEDNNAHLAYIGHFLLTGCSILAQSRIALQNFFWAFIKSDMLTLLYHYALTGKDFGLLIAILSHVKFENGYLVFCEDQQVNILEENNQIFAEIKGSYETTFTKYRLI